MDMVMQGAGDFGDQAMNNPASSIYLFLQQLPWAGLTTIVATVLAIVFFVTSGDSGALVLSNFTYRLENVNNDAPDTSEGFLSDIGISVQTMLSSIQTLDEPFSGRIRHRCDHHDQHQSDPSSLL